MSKYYKADDVINAIEDKIAEYIPTLYGRYAEIPLELRMALENPPTIEVSEDNKVLYGTDHNCILTMFGECSYNETGCSDCAVAEKIRKALSVEVSEDCISREWVLEEFSKGKEMIGKSEYFDELVWLVIHAPSVVPSTEQSSMVEDCINCDTCRFEGYEPGEEPCVYCFVNDSMWEPKTEPQKIGYCNECKWFRDK